MRLPKLLAVVAGGILWLAGAAEAQAPTGDLGLNDVVSGLISNNCAALSGAAGPYGPALAELCQVPPTGGGASSGGTPASESRLGAAGAEQRLYRRLRERREAASTDVGRGLGIFFTADYERFDQDTNRFESGFKRDTVGGTLGADYALTRWLILGGAFNYAHEFGDYDGVGGGFDHNSYGFLLYTSFLPTPQSFVDVVGGYVKRDYGFERRVRMELTGRLADGPTSGDTDGDEFRVSVSGGYDFVVDNVTVGPRLAVHYRDLAIDGFRESGNTGLELVYDNQNIVSLTTSVGLYGSIAFSTGFGVIVPQATVEYVHEFLNDQRSVGFRLAQDLAARKFRFSTDRPDRDYVYVAPGVSMVFPGGITAFANFRELLGYRDRASHAFSLGVRIPF